MPDTSDELFDLRGRRVLVAGAGGGLAEAIVRALDGRGVRLALVDNDAGRLARIAGAVPRGEALLADITDAASITAAVATASEALGGLDGAVNAAGVLPIAPARDMDAKAFTQCLENNVTGAFHFSRAVAGAMRTGGRIVHIASVSSFVANPGYAAYATSKAALHQLVRVLAREWAPEGITVNAIGPALTETPLTRDYLADPDFRRRALDVIPMGRFGTPEDLVAAVLLLLAPGGAFITGQTLCVDGGRTLV